MMGYSGARNTRGFSAAINFANNTPYSQKELYIIQQSSFQPSLPKQSHLTFQGIFNEIKFEVGQKTQKIVDLHLGYARHQFIKSKTDPNINDYLALFTKSSRDGADRNETPINALICLDVSGSMNCGLGQVRKTELSRLKLSVEAIKMFISKLRLNDSVGLVTFTDSAQVVFEPTLKSKLDNNVYQKLDIIQAGGGTTIKSGFQMSKKLLLDYVKLNECVACENRIIMLTDVNDNSLSNQQKFIERASMDDGINLSIVGISTEFRSEVCQKLKNIRGFNYFCAVNQDDIKKYVFETFDFGFFPCAHDIQISIIGDDIRSFQVYGSPDAQQVPKYNDFSSETNTNFAITKMKTAFPSELEIHQGTVLTIGGLILIKLKRKTQQAFFKGKIELRYRTPNGQLKEQSYDLNYEFHPQEQFYTADCLRTAMDAFAFTSEMRSLLIASKALKKQQVYEDYWQLLEELQFIVPESKLKDLENIKKIVQKWKEVKQEAVKLETAKDQNQYQA